MCDSCSKEVTFSYSQLADAANFVAALAIATLRNKVGKGESHYFGGVFFTRADNTAINEISDLRHKVIAASSILLMGSGQTQWQEMRKYGLDLLVDSAQVVVPVLYLCSCLCFALFLRPI
jgi:hypothetical protein